MTPAHIPAHIHKLLEFIAALFVHIARHFQ